MVPFLYVVYTLLVGLKEAIASEGNPKVASMLTQVCYATVISWCTYPVVYLFPMLGFEGPTPSSPSSWATVCRTSSPSAASASSSTTSPSPSRPRSTTRSSASRVSLSKEAGTTAKLAAVSTPRFLLSQDIIFQKKKK